MLQNKDIKWDDKWGIYHILGFVLDDFPQVLFCLYLREASLEVLVSGKYDELNVFQLNDIFCL